MVKISYTYKKKKEECIEPWANCIVASLLFTLKYCITGISQQGSKLTFLLGSTGAPNFKKLGAP